MLASFKPIIPLPVHVVTENLQLRERIEDLLTAPGLDIHLYPSAEVFLQTAQHISGCLVCALELPEMNGVELLERLQEQGHILLAIIVARNGDVPLAVRAMRAGAIEFLESKNIDARLLQTVRQMLQEIG